MHAGRSNWPLNRGVSPVAKARLPPAIITKKINSKQPSMSAGTTPTYFELPCFTRKSVCFY
jgi:hypothetical protein